MASVAVVLLGFAKIDFAKVVSTKILYEIRFDVNVPGRFCILHCAYAAQGFITATASVASGVALRSLGARRLVVDPITRTQKIYESVNTTMWF